MPFLFAPPIPAHVAPAMVAKPNPRITLAPMRKTYALGEPMSVGYQLFAAQQIPMEPIRGCLSGDTSDFHVEIEVRRTRDETPATPLLAGSMQETTPGNWVGRTMSSLWGQPYDPGEVSINDHVSIGRPGTYVVIARLRI
ncbi:MAG: hypothetical protein H8F28_17705, partial [Fibrella sp.]|nr:hypothetical protein [Armatimonadota bacterium]